METSSVPNLNCSKSTSPTVDVSSPFHCSNIKLTSIPGISSSTSDSPHQLSKDEDRSDEICLDFSKNVSLHNDQKTSLVDQNFEGHILTNSLDSKIGVNEVGNNVDKRSRKLVLDTGAFIRLERLEKYGDEFFVTPDVLNEIKDENARNHIRTLPNLPKVVNPTAEDLSFVCNFSKKTGDFYVMSHTDLSVIALTYMLQRLEAKTDHLYNKPFQVQLNIVDDNFASNDNVKNEKSVSEDILARKNTNNCQCCSKNVNDENPLRNQLPNNTQDTSTLHTSSKFCSEDTYCSCLCHDNDSGEWISEENFDSVASRIMDRSIKSYDSNDKSQENCFDVACLTTDYSIQNVLIQMGLNLINLNGLVIKSVKSWGLICRGCTNFTRNMSSLFCEKCGHDSLDRIPVTVDSQKKVIILHDRRKKINTRGTIYSIPKSSKNLIFSEDMLYVGGRDREYRHQMKLWKKETDMLNPFNLDNQLYDQIWGKRLLNASGRMAVTSAPKIVVGVGRGNPNSNRWQKNNSRRFHGKK